MDKKPRIGVDVDGVLADFLTPAYKVIEKLFGIKVDQSKQATWDMDHVIPKGKVDDFWEHIGSYNFHSELSPFPNAEDGLNKLAQVADIYIVTSHLRSGKTWVYDRDKWLMEQFGIPRRKIVHTVAKYTFNGIALVDDKPENVHKWQEEYPQGLGMLWDQPYNRLVASRLRVKNWDSVVSAVEHFRTYGSWRTE